MPVHPDFDVEAFTPTDMDSVDIDAVMPAWCELVVTVTEEGKQPVRQWLTRAAGELLIDVTGDALHPWSGGSIRDTIWQQLDEVTMRLMDGMPEPDDKGRAQGLAMALAIFRNPYDPPLDAIRDEAVERYEDAPVEDDSVDA